MDDLSFDPKNAQNDRCNMDTEQNYNQKKRRNRSTSPNQIEKTKKLKGDNMGEIHTDFIINTKPDYDNLMMESCYNIPTYRCVFLDHKIKEKNSGIKDWRYFSKKNRAAVMHVFKDGGNDNAVDSSINNEKLIDHIGDSVELRTKKFNEDLIKEPANIDLWIGFVKFQEEKLKSDMKINEFKNSADKRILNEIKMSVIDEALKKNPRNLSLALLRLEIGEMLWERERVEKCWSDLISRGRFEISFWRKYINFMKKKFESFTVSKMLEIYKECFRYMRAQVEDSFEVLGELMEFLWEVVEFLDGAGLTETCVAIFQLMFELNLNIPENIRYLPFPDKLDFLSAYWSGYQPKFGENKWMGWKEWVDVMGNSVTFVEPWTSKDVDEEIEFKVIANHHSSRPNSWFNVETYRSGNHWCSWRPEKEDDDDGEGCEDEDRIVMFDDVSAFIFYANDDNFKFQIVWKFLDYLTKHSESFCFGNFSVSGIKTGRGSYTSFKEVFQSPAEFCVVDDNLVHSDSMIANVYEVAISKFGGQHRRFLLHRFAEHILHSEKQHKEIRKIFKNILRDNNEDVSLWMKYARFERICGKMEVANKVIETTLVSLTNMALSSKKQSNDLLIRRCKIDFEIGFDCSTLCEGCSTFKKSSPKNNDRRFQDSDKILKLFDWLSDSKLEGPSGVLKVKRILEKRVEDALNDFKSDQTSSDPLLNLSLHFFQHDILHLVHLQALFAFLSTNSIANVLAVYNAVLNRLSSTSKSISSEEKEVETLHRLLSRKRWKMMAFCEDFVFIPRSAYISVAVEDIKNHPKDIMIVDNFYKINLTPSVQVVKDVMKLIYGDNDLICLKLQHIRSLIKKIVRFSETGFQLESTINELKGFFEICLSSQMASCSLTWSIYLYFHNLMKNEEKSSTRKFFRAIEGMPGSKMLYMQSILYNPDMLIKILRTMENKEVRLRTFIEEINLLTSSFKILNSMT